jgi:hypothetical protein
MYLDTLSGVFVKTTTWRHLQFSMGGVNGVGDTRRLDYVFLKF